MYNAFLVDMEKRVWWEKFATPTPLTLTQRPVKGYWECNPNFPWNKFGVSVMELLLSMSGYVYSDFKSIEYSHCLSSLSSDEKITENVIHLFNELSLKYLKGFSELWFRYHFTVNWTTSLPLQRIVFNWFLQCKSWE